MKKFKIEFELVFKKIRLRSSDIFFYFLAAFSGTSFKNLCLTDPLVLVLLVPPKLATNSRPKGLSRWFESQPMNKVKL